MIKELEKFKEKHPELNVFISPYLREDRQDSIWYDGYGGIFIYTYKNYDIYVRAVGDIRFKYKDEWYRYIENTDLQNDNDLKKIEYWDMNNWYELCIYDKKRDCYLEDIVIDFITDACDLDWVKETIKDYEGDEDDE